MIKPKSKQVIQLIRLILALAAIGLILILSREVKNSELFQLWIANYGYGAIFIIGLISGLNFVVPIPAASFVPLFLEAGLNYWLIIIIVTVGMTIADLIAYIIGRAGRELTFSLTQSKLFDRLEKWCDRNYWWPLIFFVFYAALIPLPNEIVIIPLAILGYRFRHLIIPLLIGNFIFNLLFSQGLTLFT